MRNAQVRCPTIKDQSLTVRLASTLIRLALVILPTRSLDLYFSTTFACSSPPISSTGRFCMVIWEGRARGQKGHHTRGFFILRVNPEGFSPSQCWLSHIAIKLTRLRFYTSLPRWIESSYSTRS